MTGMYPFKTSSSKVRNARNLFPVLRTFVAPMFPDPIFLMSFFFKSLININPNGTDPLK